MNKKGFTLLEVMIASLILTATAVGIYTISVQTKKQITKSEHSITAMYLAQEGLEFVRNIRDQNLSNSLNKEKGWNVFLENIGYKNNRDDKNSGNTGNVLGSGGFLNFSNFLNGGVLIKKLNIGKNGIIKIENAGVDFEKKISKIDDICKDVGVFKDCIYEYINIENLGNEENGNFGKNFFRKIKIYKKNEEFNLINVKSEIIWEEQGKIKNFILEQNLGNISMF